MFESKTEKQKGWKLYR